MKVLLFNLCLLCTFLPPTSPSSVSDLPLVVSNNNPTANDVEKYRTLVEELESSVGRHHPKVAEALIQLAQILSQLNLYAEADETLDRSLQITRLSDGIFSSTRAHVLYLKIQNSIFLGDWEKTNKIMERLQRLKYRKNEELIKALISLSDVHFNAIPFDSEKNKTCHLQNALALNWGPVILGKT